MSKVKLEISEKKDTYGLEQLHTKLKASPFTSCIFISQYKKSYTNTDTSISLKSCLVIIDEVENKQQSLF